jgi:hypothetical protein
MNPNKSTLFFKDDAPGFDWGVEKSRRGPCIFSDIIDRISNRKHFHQVLPQRMPIFCPDTIKAAGDRPTAMQLHNHAE